MARQPGPRKGPADWRRAAEVFKTLGNAHRLDILLMLAEGTQSSEVIHAIHREPGESYSQRISVGLIHLRAAGLVDSKRGGRNGDTHTLTDEGRRVTEVLTRFVLTFDKALAHGPSGPTV